MSLAPIRLETVVRPAPFGVVFHDVATGNRIDNGLRVTLTPLVAGGRAQQLAHNRSGIWFANRLPGVTDARLADTADWSGIARDYRLSVEDREGRFLPLSIVVRLPVRGLYNWPVWPTLPRPPLVSLIDVPPAGAIAPGWLPLFPAAARTAPAPMAEVRALLVDRATGVPAAWTLVTAAYDNRARAIGLSGADGQIVLFFPYPPLPRPSIVNSPPAITDYRWPVTLAAYRSALPATPVPDFAAIMAQLSHPATLYATTTSPEEQLPPQLLSLGRPLTLRTTATPDGPTSALFVGTD